MTAPPVIQRVRYELRRRRLTVLRVERVAPALKRIVLTGDELEGFTSLGFDDHIKLFFPAGGDVAMRDFTPRRYDKRSGELWVDFFLHDAGPATAWAAQAQPGHVLEIGGPRRSAILPTDGISVHVLIGDETAVPAIARRLEELPTGARASALVEVDAGEPWPAFSTDITLETTWVTRRMGSYSPGQELIAALQNNQFPAASFFWVATESAAARAIRHYLRDERGIDKGWIKAAGYWKRNAVGQHETLDDEE